MASMLLLRYCMAHLLLLQSDYSALIILRMSAKIFRGTRQSLGDDAML